MDMLDKIKQIFLGLNESEKAKEKIHERITGSESKDFSDHATAYSNSNLLNDDEASGGDNGSSVGGGGTW